MSNKRKSNRKGKGRSPKHNKHIPQPVIRTRLKRRATMLDGFCLWGVLKR